MAKKPSCHIGTSGWHYSGWKGVFYPKGCPQKEYLSFYGDRFDTVEINNSFYHLPSADTFSNGVKRSAKVLSLPSRPAGISPI
jgi:uncharacterized protein YecE (DUF72 family)